MRDKLVQCKSCGECTNNGFNTPQLHQKPGREDDEQHKNKVGIFFRFSLLKEPFGYARDNEENNKREENKRDKQLQQKTQIQSPVTAGEDHRQYDQHCCIGEDGPPNGDGYRLISGDTHTADNGICHQRVGREHAGREKAGIGIVTQQIKTYGITDEQGDDKSVKTKRKTFVPVLLKLTQIEFQTNNKHDIQQSYGGEYLHPPLGMINKVKPIRAHDHTCHDQSDNTGDIKTFKKYGSQQNNQQKNGEYQYRIGER